MDTQVSASYPAIFVREILPFLVAIGTLAVFQFGGHVWLVALNDHASAGILFVWLFLSMLWAAFGVVRHADALAERFGEPYGTLILTLSVTGIEVTLISSVMLTGEAAPALARDTMLAVLMIVLNGLIGVALLIGGLAHREQAYNLQGANAFLAVILPLAVFSLVLPRFTTSTDEPTFSSLQAVFFAGITALLYGVFLMVQTIRHRGYFQEPVLDQISGKTAHHDAKPRPVGYHALLLLLTLLSIVLLSKPLAKLVDYGIVEAAAPTALGGAVIALLVLTPEGLAALGAARANHLQRSINLLLGSALATIGLTVPAVLAISVMIDQPIVLGLDNVQMVLLLLTLMMSALTFGGVRTNVLQGAVHCVLFLAYFILIFNP